MHWSRVGWLLLIVVALAEARERPKRHLPLLKKIASHILGGNTQNELPKEENYKLYKIPGLDNVLIKAIPKVTIKEAVPKTVLVEAVKPSVADVKSYIDTETALQKIANFLKLCIFNDNQEEVQKEVIVPINSYHNTIKYTETETNEQYEVKSPSFTEVKNPMYVVPTLSGPYIEAVDVIQRRPVAVDFPPLSVTLGQVKISEVVNATVPTKYSYKQSSHDGTVTTYESKDNPNVLVTRTTTIPVLPSYIKIRIQEAAAIGISPPRLIQSVPAVPAYSRPVAVLGPRPTPIDVFRSPEAFIKESFVPISLPPFISQSASARPPPGFEILGKSGYLTGYDVYGPPIVVGSDENRNMFGIPIPLPPGYSPIIETSQAKINTNGKVNVNISKTYKDKTNNKINIHTNSDSIPNNYLYVPPTRGNIGHSSDNNGAKLGENLCKYQDTISNTKTDDCLKSGVYSKPMDQLTAKNSNYLNRNPIVVPDDETFVYRQKNADGSSISIKGNAQNTVTVHVEESKHDSNQDGTGSDIPGAEF